MCDPRIEKLLLIAPPESAKTTWTISAFLGCYIGFYPENSIIIGSVSGTVAEKRGLGLRSMVESDEWRATFPGVDVVKADAGFKWGVDEWSVAPDGKPRPGRIHPTVSSVGRGGSIIGSRADLAVLDDFLDLDSTRTATQREFNEQWLHTSFLSRRKSRTEPSGKPARAVMIGTSWHHDDSYARAAKEGGWVVCKMSLLSESSDVYATLTYPDSWQYERVGVPIAGAVA
jgi:hypothetical protein